MRGRELELTIAEARSVIRVNQMVAKSSLAAQFGGVIPIRLRGLALLMMTLATGVVLAQSTTKVSGVVKDSKTQEGLPFVDVYFENTTTGVSTDADGYYEISTEGDVVNLVASFIGYKQEVRPIVIGQSQTINVELSPDAIETVEALVTAKKEKYSRKNNPAVDLMREVIARKDRNGVSGQAFVSYDKYEKIQADLNNIDIGFRERKIFNGLEFLWAYLDSADVDSKPYLPMLLRETASKVYHRADPDTEREYISGSLSSKLDIATDQSNLNEVINALYQDVNIYDDEITLVQKQFISPLSPQAISFYRFYILDTVDVGGQPTTHLGFIPKNQATYGFTGDLYITSDSMYQVAKVKMGLYGEVNLNFVRAIDVEQEFVKVDSSLLLSRDRVVMDFAPFEKGMGFTGTKTVLYAAYDFAPPQDLSVFDGVDRVTTDKLAEFRSSDYWDAKRQVPLNDNEAGIYRLVDTLPTVPKFKQIQKISKILLTGYVTVGKFEVGPLNSFVGFNLVEGLKPKFGGETNLKFSKKVFLQGYVAYGVDDQRFKYAALGTYSFNDNHLKNPRHYVTASYIKDTGFPGYDQAAVSSNNIVSSLRWGILDKMLFSTTIEAKYVEEHKSLEYGVSYTNTQRRPYGNLEFDYGPAENRQIIESVNTSEIGLSIRFAPNQQYTQRGSVRNRIYNKYPIFSLSYGLGIEDMLGGDYGYHKLDVSAFKQFGLGIFGYTHAEISGGKVFGEVPYILMHIPQANQTYAYKVNEYNLMNFMEFVGDQYVDINVRHYFEGFFFNRLPLVKKAKLREVVTFKAIFGSVSDKNNPFLNRDLIQFPIDEQDRYTTTTLSSAPYVEAGFGIMNIAKVLRVDLVQRLTYLDRPNVPELFGNKGLAIRAALAVDF